MSKSDVAAVVVVMDRRKLEDWLSPKRITFSHGKITARSKVSDASHRSSTEWRNR